MYIANLTASVVAVAGADIAKCFHCIRKLIRCNGRGRIG
ncbi:hypothetical protein DSOL_1584 [Desulfosporosinus metallidurans]|uniref:Uncharacterized protein n=1 Tax=Desulfosporosinus metallidurans TaxID=1888891 RepID=A0A1Q8QZ01_9FIRM|nr:hypothetical protein DSOL_1584 [Desulfosporosinus metallidurans]